MKVGLNRLAHCECYR